MDIYTALTSDHDKIKELLTNLCALNEDDESRHGIIEQIEKELVPHARAEESVFYNTLRAIDADESLKGHGYSEHMMAETLLRTLQGASKMDSGWKGAAEKLRDALFHHIQEEEGAVFSEARTALTHQEAESIGEAFLSLKPKMQEKGMVGNAMEMVKNLMPPRFADKVRDLGDDSSRHAS